MRCCTCINTVSVRNNSVTVAIIEQPVSVISSLEPQFCQIPSSPNVWSSSLSPITRCQSRGRRHFNASLGLLSHILNVLTRRTNCFISGLFSEICQWSIHALLILCCRSKRINCRNGLVIVCLRHYVITLEGTASSSCTRISSALHPFAISSSSDRRIERK